MASNESKCRDCGEILVWDDKNLTANGKKFPVEKSGQRHNCPMSKYNKTKDKSLGDKTPLEALGWLMTEMKSMKKRLDSVEIEVKWGDKKTGTEKKPNIGTEVRPIQPNGEIDWDAMRAKEPAKETPKEPAKTGEDPLEKFRK